MRQALGDGGPWAEAAIRSQRSAAVAGELRSARQGAIPRLRPTEQACQVVVDLFGIGDRGVEVHAEPGELAAGYPFENQAVDAAGG
jgi:hypothetical protein